jgi:hypothetical protein
MHPEIQRIIEIPDMGPEFRKCPETYFQSLYKPGAKMRLNPTQIEALWVASHVQGLFASLAVGSGKTLITLLLPSVIPCERPALMIPPSMVEPLKEELQKFSEHFHITKIPTIIPYSLISGQNNYGSDDEPRDLLHAIAPDLIICDEAHNLSAEKSARTKRFLRYLKAHPSTRLCVLSGTLAKTSLRDFAHLMQWSLRQYSPLPEKWNVLESWANVIDSGKDGFSLADLDLLRPLADKYLPARLDLATTIQGQQEIVRAAFLERLKTTPGVVLTQTGSVDLPVYLTEIETLQVPAEIQRALCDCETTWKLPGGEEIISPLELAARLKEIALGFHYFWQWPDNKPDWEWLEARATYRREIRTIVMQNLPRLDTPGLVEKALKKGTLDAPTLIQAQQKWGYESQRYLALTGRTEPETKTRWLSYYVLEDVHLRIQYLKASRENCVIWYSHKAVAEELRRMPDVQVIEPGAEVLPFDFVACSVDSHGTGRNLQRWSNNIILSPSSSGAKWEQLIGRTHRQGQSKPVNIMVYSHTPHLQNSVQTSNVRSKFIQQVLGQEQKLLHITQRFTL